MKCNSLVKWTNVRRKGSGETYRKPMIAVYLQNKAERLEQFAGKGYEFCQGNISVTLDVEDGFYDEVYGLDYDDLIIQYRCDVCGNEQFPHLELPTDKYQLSDYLTKKIAEKPDKPLKVEGIFCMR